MTQNLGGNEDIRVLRTRKLLLTALMELTIEEGFNSVTIKDICERAMVNRATFYRHYLDKYDLLDQYMDEIYELLDRSQAEASFDGPPVGLVRMLEHLRSHADFYRVMLGPKGYPPFAERIRFYIENRFRRSMPANIDQRDPGRPPFDMMLRAISSAGLGAILWWLDKDMPVTSEQMATWAIQISKANFNLL